MLQYHGLCYLPTGSCSLPTLIPNLPAAPARYPQLQSILQDDHRQIESLSRPSLTPTSLAYIRRLQLSRDEASSLSSPSPSPHAVPTLDAPSPCSERGKVERSHDLVGGGPSEATGVSISTAETMPSATVSGQKVSAGGAAEEPSDYDDAMIGAKGVNLWHPRPNTAENSSLSNRGKKTSAIERREVSSVVPSSLLVDYNVTTTWHDRRAVEAPGKGPLDEVHRLNNASSPWTPHSSRTRPNALACKQVEKRPLLPPDWPLSPASVNHTTEFPRRKEKPVPSTVKVTPSMQKIMSPSLSGSVRGVGIRIPSNDEFRPHSLRAVKASERRTLGIGRCPEGVKRKKTDRKRSCVTTSLMKGQHRLQERSYARPSCCSVFKKKAFGSSGNTAGIRGTCLKTRGIAFNPPRVPAEVGTGLDCDGIHKDMRKPSGERNGSACENCDHGGRARQPKRIPCNGYLLYVRDLSEDPANTRITCSCEGCGWTPHADKGDSMVNCGMSMITHSLNSMAAPSTPFIRCKLVGMSPCRCDVIIFYVCKAFWKK